jgi:hypothetical protein
LLNKVGFLQADFLRRTGFKSSPYTEGALFYGEKPRAAEIQGAGMTPKDALQTYQEFTGLVFGPGTLDRKTKYLIALGASLTAGCDP